MAVPSPSSTEERGEFLKPTRSTHLAAADPAVSSPPPAASAAGGWGNAGSRCVNSVGLARSSAGGVGRAVALPVWCFAGGDLPLRRRRSGGAPKWICYLRRARSSGQLSWATSLRRRSKTATSAFGVLDSARVEASLRCDRWSRMEALRSSSSDDFPSA